MDATPLNVVGIAGSLRRGSHNRGLIRAAVDLAPWSMRVTLHDIGDLPLFNADVEALGDPDPVRRLKEAIGAADALLIATPEYNRCVPGVLKNAIDWASRPARQSVLTNKPVAIMGASTGGGGTARAQAHLRDGLGYTNGLVLPQPEVLVRLPPRVSTRRATCTTIRRRMLSGTCSSRSRTGSRHLREGLSRAA